MEKKKWSELTKEQQEDFKKQILFVGDKSTNYESHIYQIKDGKCHGWIVNGANRIK